METSNTTTDSGDANVPFKLDPIQSGIYDRLYRLVGPGAAEFYKDACHLISNQSYLASTSHVVSHLLREIESALRAVLKSLTGPIDKINEKCKECGQVIETLNHKAAILLIVKALHIEESDPLTQSWLSLPGQ